MAAITVASTSRGWYKASTTFYWSARVAFVVGSALYVVTQDTGATPKVRVWKSTSLSAPSFSEMDNANAPTVGDVTYAYSAWYAAGLIDVGAMTAVATLRHYRFDTATDLWTTDNGTISTICHHQRSLRLSTKSTGVVVATFTDNSDDADLRHVRWESAAWASALFLAGTSVEASALLDNVVDGSDINHYVWQDCGSDKVSFRSYTTTLGTAIDLDTAVIADETGYVMACYDVYPGATDQIVAAYLDADGSLVERTITLESTSDAGDLAAAATIQATATDVGANTVVATAVYDGIPWALWWDDAADGTFYYSTKTAGTWAAKTLWKSQDGGGITSTTNMVLQLVPIAGAGLLAVYQDGTDVKTDFLVTVEPSVASAGQAPIWFG